MAIPSSLFQVKCGVALMRQNNATSEWFFVGWANKNFSIDSVTAGSYTYALWLIAGYNVAGLVSVNVTGTSKIVIVQCAK